MSDGPPSASRRDAALADEVRALGEWFHNLRLDGVQTAPHHRLGDFPENFFQYFAHALPTDLSGCTVLDIGCNAGFYSFEMKRRGAARVVAMDVDPRYLAQARLASGKLGLDVELRQGSVYDVARLGQRFDVVLFMGVLYHLRHPLLALDLLRRHAVGGLLVFQSMLRGSSQVTAVEPDYDIHDQAPFADPGFPRLSFIEHRYAGDPTNWWIPNPACAAAMLRSAGFSIESHPVPEVFICRADGPAAELPAPFSEATRA